MRVGYVIIFIWCLGAVFMYKRYGFVIDKVKEQNKDSSPRMYDFAGIVVFIFWPLFLPSILVKTGKKLKDKQKEKDGKE